MIKPKKDIEFNLVLLEAIDEALMTLGVKAKASLYLHLEKTFGLPQKDIPEHIGEFAYAIERIFGHASEQIEILIMKCLNQRIQGSYEWSGPKWLVPDLTFTRYIRLMRLHLEDTQEIADIEVLLDAGEQEEQT